MENKIFRGEYIPVWWSMEGEEINEVMATGQVWAKDGFKLDPVGPIDERSLCETKKKKQWLWRVGFFLSNGLNSDSIYWDVKDRGTHFINVWWIS